MSLQQVNTIQVSCDDEDIANQGRCWTEEEPLVLSIEPGETKKDAIEFLKKMGWDIQPVTKAINDSIKVYDYKCLCPWCNMAITKEDYEAEIEAERHGQI